MNATRPACRQLELSLGAAPKPGRTGGAELERKNQVEYLEMRCRSVLNWVEGSRASDFYSANPYRGCEFGCAYCYARYTHDYLDLKGPEDFERRVFVKVNAAEAMLRDLKRVRAAEHGIGFGSATDCYQPAERLFGITRRMLEALLPLKGIPVHLVTKSGLVERDAALLGELSRRHRLKVLVSCATLDPVLQRALEPRAHVPERRFAAASRLRDQGVDVGLILAPILPGLGDAEDDLLAVCRRAREAGFTSVMGQVLFLPKASQRCFFPWLQRNHPELWGRYRRSYAAGRSPEQAYRDLARARLARAVRGAGFPEAEGRVR